VVKLDGHFYTGEANAENYPRPTMFGTIEDALEVGAAAVGLSFYLGSRQTGEDVERIGKIRKEAHHSGLPLVLWSYPRGLVPDSTKKDSLLWCHYAVSATESLGAGIVKTKFPSVVEPKKREKYEEFIKEEYSAKIPEAVKYIELEPDRGKLMDYGKKMEEEQKKPNYDSLLTKEQHIERAKIVVGAGTRTFVIFSGGPRITGEAKVALENSTEIIMEAGGEGRIIGRNLWGVPTETGLEYVGAVKKVMQNEKYRR
jgi:class I fructose-bisphosphate aldolase